MSSQKAHEERNAGRVLVVGAGALGCAAARTLAAAGNVSIALADDDRVEASNLQRQVLYRDADIGRLKVEAAATALRDEFGAAVEAIDVRLTPPNAADLIAAADVVIDATDDVRSKFTIGRTAVELGRAYVYGGVVRTGGLWMLVVPGRSACLECAFTASGPADEPGCSQLGILAPVAGLVGAMQALAAWTWLNAPERAAAGRLYVYEATRARIGRIDIPPRPDCSCRSATRSGTRRWDLEERRTAS